MVYSAVGRSVLVQGAEVRVAEADKACCGVASLPAGDAQEDPGSQGSGDPWPQQHQKKTFIILFRKPLQSRSSMRQCC